MFSLTDNEVQGNGRVHTTPLRFGSVLRPCFRWATHSFLSLPSSLPSAISCFLTPSSRVLSGSSYSFPFPCTPVTNPFSFSSSCESFVETTTTRECLLALTLRTLSKQPFSIFLARPTNTSSMGPLFPARRLRKSESARILKYIMSTSGVSINCGGFGNSAVDGQSAGIILLSDGGGILV